MVQLIVYIIVIVSYDLLLNKHIYYVIYIYIYIYMYLSKVWAYSLSTISACLLLNPIFLSSTEGRKQEGWGRAECVGVSLRSLGVAGAWRAAALLAAPHHSRVLLIG